MMNFRIERTTSHNEDFRKLVNLLDKYLSGVNGAADEFFVPHNRIDILKNVVVVYDGNTAVGCGAMKEFDAQSMEVKRMYVPVERRGKGIAGMVLKELESWATELGYKRCVLETALSMADAVGLYKKNGYSTIPNYEPYTNIETSVCFEKTFTVID